MIIRIEQASGQAVSESLVEELLDAAALVIAPVGYRFPSHLTSVIPSSICQLDTGTAVGALVLTTELGLPDLTIDQLRRHGWCLPAGTVDELVLAELCRLSLYRLPDNFSLPIQLGSQCGWLSVRGGRPVIMVGDMALTPSVWLFHKLLLSTAVASKPAEVELVLSELTEILNRLVPLTRRR